MGLRKISILLLAALFCGCEAQKAAEPAGPAVKKDKKVMQKGGTAEPGDLP